MALASAELTSGTGFEYEAYVAAYYLTALICENSAAALGNRVVTCVSLQQGVNGEPLDDVIIDAGTQSEYRLRLQAKRSLKAIRSHDDFGAVVHAAWESLKLPNFRVGIDRVGGATEFMSDAHYRQLTLVCERARGVALSGQFFQGLISQKQKDIVETFRDILKDRIGTVTDEELFHLLRHFLVVRLSLLGEAATNTAESINHLRSALRETEQNAASSLWDRLATIARSKASVNAIVDRKQLQLELSRDFAFLPSQRLASAINILTKESRNGLLDVRDDISGFHIERSATLERVAELASTKKLVLLHGQPGCGKTVVLKSLASQRSESGPVVFLKSDRLSGNSWNQYASSLGLASVDLRDLISEFVVLGVNTFFIDGLDRLGRHERNIVIDLVNAITQVSRDDLRIVATLRDNGLEAVRDWLPRQVMNSGSMAYVAVNELTQSEATQLATDIPSLRPLLFATSHLRAVVRRPFFLALLAEDRQILLDELTLSEFTEDDLLQRWWRKGGYSSADEQTIARQNTLSELAASVATQMGWQARQSALSPIGVLTIPHLIADGIVQQATHSRLKFAHDIFFEWCYVQYLAGTEMSVTEALLEARQPPALGRCVELFSQITIKTAPASWTACILRLNDDRLRSQWTRCWFFGGFLSGPVTGASEVLESALFDDSARNLHKLFVWLQAEKTQPNPVVLAENPSKLDAELQHVQAYLLSIPSDLLLWRRVLHWALVRAAKLPKVTIPALIQCFEVWQNVWADHANALSERIVDQSLIYLEELEGLRDSGYRERLEAEWNKLGTDGVDELKQQLRRLILRSTRAYTARVEQYLSGLGQQRRISRQTFSDIQQFSPILAERLPAQIRDVTLAILLEPLPEDHLERERQRQEEMRNESERIRVIPAEKRSRLDQLSLSNVFLGPSLPHDVRNSLCIDDDHYGQFFPASPLREPFASLLSVAPEVGLEIVRSMSCHSIDAWLQLCRIQPVRYGTPLSIRLTFPWGNQEFWGDATDYQWHRGHGASHALCSALMALESWAFGQIESGRGRDEVLQQLLEGNKSLSVLGIALAICLERPEPTATSLQLVACQRLWALDAQRLMNDMSASNLTGFGGFGRRRVDDETHVDAVKASNSRASRKVQLQALYVRHALSDDAALRQSAQDAIREFPTNLPYTTEEQKSDSASCARMKAQAEVWAELGKAENYSWHQADGQPNVFVLEHDNPRLREPEIAAQADCAQRHLTISNIAVWARRSVENEIRPDQQKLVEYVQFLRSLEQPTSSPGDRDDIAITTAFGALIGVSALCVVHHETIESDVLKWAELNIDRCYEMCAAPQGNPEHGPLSLWHPSQAVVYAYLSKLSSGQDTSEMCRRLLRLIAQDNVEEALQAAKLVFLRWSDHPRLCVAAIDLSSRLACVRPRFLHPEYEIDSDAAAHPDTDDIVRLSIALLESTDEHPIIFVPPERSVDTSTEDELVLTEDELPWFGVSNDEIGYWQLDTFAKVVRSAPLLDIASRKHYHSAAEEFAASLLGWTKSRLGTPDATRQNHGRRDYEPSVRDWLDALGWCLGNSGLLRDSNTAYDKFVAPVLQFAPSARSLVLGAFVRRVICAIHDEVSFPVQAALLLDQCATGMVEHDMLKRTWRDEVRIRDDAVSEILRDIFLISIEKAERAARFSNGLWVDLPRMLSTVDKVIDAAGWSISVASDFVSLAEHAKLFYPTEAFSLHALRLVTFEQGNGWLNTTLPRRVAALVQLHAEQSEVSDSTREKLLRVLDCLVDLGDRRSAALQLTPVFVDVRLSSARGEA